MSSPQDFEVRVVQRLDAEAETSRARVLKGAQLGQIGVTGIALEGDLGVGVDIEQLLSAAQDPKHVLSGHERRRATAEEHAVYLLSIAPIAGQLA